MESRRAVIVVDDEPITRMDLSQMLQELGFIVPASASDGFDAINLCRIHQPDLVLMDIKMPIFDGLTAAETIIREELAGCIVLLTAFSDNAFIRRATDIGVSGYLVKPIEEQRLLPAIEVAMGQAQHLKKSRLETADAIKQIEQSRLMERAKVILARERGITEGEAYRQMQRLAMDKRCQLVTIAKAIVTQGSAREMVNKAKKRLIEAEGLSEAAAYKKVERLSRSINCSMDEAARSILSDS